MDQLYLLEVLVNTIEFAPRIPEVPEKKNIVISVCFSNLAELNIQSDPLSGFSEKHDPFRRDLNINSGKSYLFPSKPENLIKALKDSPLQIIVKIKDDAGSMGEASIPWEYDFLDMVDKSRCNADNVTPASCKNVYEVTGQDGQLVGKIELFIKLSCYGQSIQTQFQVVTRAPIAGGLPTQRYLFKGSNADTTFQAQKIGSEDASPEMVPIAPLYNPADPHWRPQVVSPADLTADKINQVLCKNKDCPGAQKFKDYGLGPAATGKGLGTLYGDIEVPISYGLSHTYGSFENYGPYGIYTRPKRLDEPFIPKEPLACSTTPGCQNCGSCDPNDACECGNTDDVQQESCGACCCCSDPLRLTGGSPGEDDNKTPQPMLMCKDLMLSYDKVLNEYKKAVGPCGQNTCPYSPNVTTNSCRKYCANEVTVDSVAGPSGGEGLVSACGTVGCPFSRPTETATDRSFQQKQMKSACGSPSCPYTRRKLGKATSEDILEMQLMDGPSIAQPCGNPKCPFPIAPLPPPLEPIHWDCPDPLPKGPCRNPNCPLKPKELRYNPMPKGPCGSPRCPYAPPPYCGDENCPFAPPRPCPYEQSSPSGCVPGCGADAEESTQQCQPGCGGGGGGMRPNSRSPSFGQSPRLCGGSGCPYAQQSSGCGGPTCPFSQSHSSGCGGPSCPFSSRPPSPPDTCGGPACPFSQPPRPSTPCAKPTCPFAQSNSICGNSECPYAAPSSPGPCGAPTCPYGGQPSGGGSSGGICSNPECPFASKPESPGGSACGNPACPFAKQEPSLGAGGECGNPACPYASKQPSLPKGSICSNPSCPYAPPPCSYVNPCKLNIGGTKVTVEYGLDGKGKGGETEYTSGDRDPNADVGPCSPRTCKAYGTGGSLVCGDCSSGNGGGSMPCPCGGTLTVKVGSSKETERAEKEIKNTAPKGSSISAPSISQKQQPPPDLERTTVSEKQIRPPVVRNSGGGKTVKNGKSRNTPKYVYKLGDLYPGVHVGHRECIIPGRNVPAKMGWLWNIHVPCVGLKPRIGWRPGAVGRSIAKKILAHRKAKGIKLLESLTPKSSKKRVQARSSGEESESDATVAPKPTLLVKKREGCYYITMNPLKDPKTIEDNENPYMDCTPLQFKITKKKEDEEEGKACFCDEGEESSDSELDIEFTPPAGIIRPERLKRKKNIAHTDTQYNPADFTVKDPKKDDKGKKGSKDKGGKKGGKKGKK